MIIALSAGVTHDSTSTRKSASNRAASPSSRRIDAQALEHGPHTATVRKYGVLSGTATAPIRVVANQATAHSTLLGIRIPTWSPFPIPSASIANANHDERR